MTGDINMSMITQEIEKEEKETEIMVEKLATKLDHLKVRNSFRHVKLAVCVWTCVCA